MGGNHFYSNAEAYAHEILQQKLIKEAQRSAQQTVMELSALKSLFNQGQFIYCIPFGGTGLLGQNIPFTPLSPFSNICPLEPNFMPPDPYYPSYPPQQTPPSQPLQPLQSLQPPQINSSCAPINPMSASENLLHSLSHGNNKQSVVHVNLKNQPKFKALKSDSDKCDLGKDGIDVTVDLREYLPAEIFINVEEKSIEVKACHVSEVGKKTFARRYDLPACIALDSVKCVLSHDGYLMFSALWMKME